MLKPYRPLLILFVMINACVLVWKSRLLSMGIKYEVITVANMLLFLFTLVSLLLQVKAAANKNPNAIVRAVMAGMGLKLIGFASALLIYIYLAGKEKSAASVYVCLGLYLMYMWLEVRLFLKQNPKKNGQG